nr:MAG TPA: hypothetical protein [Caudoviricetes sp.]
MSYANKSYHATVNIKHTINIIPKQFLIYLVKYLYLKYCPIFCIPS